MKERTHILHTAQLNNNCPTCYGKDGLEFTFSQKEKENSFYKKPSSIIDELLYCHNCKTNIYPVNWTNDIELVYDYNKKIAETYRHYLQVKPLSYILIILAIVIIAIGVYFLL